VVERRFFMAEKKKDNRARVWAMVVYPESAPKNWRDILDSKHIPWIESPLHNKDVNPDGEVKKPHWHVMMKFEGLKSFEQVKEIADSINAPIPQKVASPVGQVRYMIHMDNPEKYQYKREDIIPHGGADVDAYFEISATAKNRILWAMMEYINKNHVTSYAQFIGYIQSTENHDWFDIAVNRNTLALKTLIDSNFQDFKRQDPIIQAQQMHEKGYSIREIASFLGISRSTIQRYLHK